MRPEKDYMIQEIQARLQGTNAIFLASYNGLGASDFDAIRGELQEVNGDLMVVKNRLFNRAIKDTYKIDLTDKVTGQTAMATCKGDPVSIVKFIMSVGKKNTGVEVKLGIMNNELIEKERIHFLSTLPSKEALLAKTVGAIGSPITGFVFLLKNMLTGLAVVLKNIGEKKEEEE